MKSYIVRIYRDEKKSSEGRLGTVERPGEEVKLAFTSFDELRDILSIRAEKDVFSDVWEPRRGGKSNQGH